MHKLASRQTAITYWGTPAPTGVGGWTFASPITFKGRWEERTERTLDRQGNDFTSTAQVFVPDTQVLDLGGYLYRGTSVGADPTEVPGARPIAKIDSIPDLRAISQQNKAYL